MVLGAASLVVFIMRALLRLTPMPMWLSTLSNEALAEVWGAARYGAIMLAICAVPGVVASSATWVEAALARLSALGLRTCGGRSCTEDRKILIPSKAGDEPRCKSCSERSTVGTGW
jgi:hypothetical protein